MYVSMYIAICTQLAQVIERVKRNEEGNALRASLELPEGTRQRAKVRLSYLRFY